MNACAYLTPIVELDEVKKHINITSTISITLSSSHKLKLVNENMLKLEPINNIWSEKKYAYNILIKGSSYHGNVLLIKNNKFLRMNLDLSYDSIPYFSNNLGGNCKPYEIKYF